MASLLLTVAASGKSVHQLAQCVLLFVGVNVLLVQKMLYPKLAKRAFLKMETVGGGNAQKMAGQK
ncbi:hypothetical protein [Leeia oryzae]|uniref:hypothetical protein n=1 Tax=Leeia oryzae TaxID=356662 RepID=UPI000380F1D9|nr:hypothetical protein [Leeia oryzae]